ncbi:cytochrome P450 [Streptomyces iconiensis]|uniref:Cytochrome P450 n=1 Tax=Streptomyces iconiensis TaxID=1384038 RepID=A0ABT6ZQC1_9ACTN|nr:cytochrome P450 [Streptomyces iconiensis]MDJ1131253.1 cytochrome P450 [Streptomyces iconiensis]
MNTRAQSGGGAVNPGDMNVTRRVACPVAGQSSARPVSQNNSPSERESSPSEQENSPWEVDVEWPLDRRGDVVPEVCTWLREHKPVARVRTLSGDPAWLVSTHELATRVLQDDTFSMSALANPGSRLQYAPLFPASNRSSVKDMVDVGLRETVMQALSPHAVKEVTGDFRRRADELLDALLAEGPPVDVRARFTQPYTGSVMSAILGLSEDHGSLLMSGFDISIMTVPRSFEGAQVNWRKSMERTRARLLAPDAVEAPGLLGALARLRAGKGTTAALDEEMVLILNNLFVAGGLSASAFLLLALLLLMLNRDQMEWLRAHPEAMEPAVEELLRYSLAIGDGLPRIATRDTELGGQSIAKGDLVLVLVEGANYDPAAFQAPQKLDLKRHPKAHLTFGAGRHYCSATFLARTHASIALSAVLERMPELRLAIPAEEISWRSGWIKRTPERLPVLW